MPFLLETLVADCPQREAVSVVFCVPFLASQHLRAFYLESRIGLCKHYKPRAIIRNQSQYGHFIYPGSDYEVIGLQLCRFHKPGTRLTFGVQNFPAVDKLQWGKSWNFGISTARKIAFFAGPWYARQPLLYLFICWHSHHFC